MKRIALVVAVCGALAVPVAAGAQLDLNQIVQLLNDLKNQVAGMQAALGAQAAQVDALGEQWTQAQTLLQRVPQIEAQLAPVLSQWPDLKGSLDQVFALQRQVAPLLAQWPAVQEMVQAVAGLQSGFNDQLSALAQLQALVAEADGGEAGAQAERLDAFEAELGAAQTRQLALQGELDGLRLGVWLALGAGLALLAINVVLWARALWTRARRAKAA